MDHLCGHPPPLPCDRRHVRGKIIVEVELLPDGRNKCTRYVSYIDRHGEDQSDTQTWVEAAA